MTGPRFNNGGTNGHARGPLGKEDAKRKVLEQISLGRTVRQAVESTGRKSTKTYEQWRKEDEKFRDAADMARSLVKRSGGDRQAKRQAAIDMGFVAFRERYLNRETPWHQLQWVDILDGKDPRDLHEAQTWVKVGPQRVIVNCPPEFAKTTTISTDYSVYRIVCDPNVRIKIVSATERMAKTVVYGIKLRLTQPQYKDLITDFAPEGGFRASAQSWTTEEIYIGERDSSEKDPTLQALGVGSQIYGSRCDLIIVDDGTDLRHAGDYRKQFDYISQECDSRLGIAGMMLIVGTRVATVDLYSELGNPENYPLGMSPWSWLTQPAILEETATPETWVTLWPRSREAWGPHTGCGHDDCNVPGEDGLVPHWDGPHLSLVQARKPPRMWALVYQQSSLDDDMVFPMHAINDSIDAARRSGSLNSRYTGDLRDMYFIAGLDPATTGQAGAVVLAVDRKSGKRFVVDAKVLFGPTPRELKDLVKDWSGKYPINMWAVDKTGLNTYFVQDDELQQWLSSRGIRLAPHYIGGNKWDPVYGIASLDSLFGNWERRDGKPHRVSEPIISLPRLESDGIKALVHQLQVWSPDADPKRVPQDVLMALWMAEIQAREVVRKGAEGTGRFRKSGFYSPRDVSMRAVVNLSDYRGAVVA